MIYKKNYLIFRSLQKVNQFYPQNTLPSDLYV